MHNTVHLCEMVSVLMDTGVTALYDMSERAIETGGWRGVFTRGKICRVSTGQCVYTGNGWELPLALLQSGACILMCFPMPF